MSMLPTQEQRIASLEEERDEARELAKRFMLERNAAQVERDRLVDGIREHRDHNFPGGIYPLVVRIEQMQQVNERLWSLLDVAGEA